MMVGTVDLVRKLVAGSTLAATLTVGDLTVKVASAGDFGGQYALRINGSTLPLASLAFADTYGSGVTVDTVTLVSTSPVSGVVGDRVDARPKSVEYIADVYIEGALVPDRAIVPPHLADDEALAVSSGGLGTIVELRDTGRGWIVARVIGKGPSRSGTALTAGSVSLAALDAPLQSMLGGTGASAYRHTQVSPASSWTVVHNLGRNPGATIVLDTIGWVLTDLTYVDSNTLSIQFPSAVSGTADVV